MYVFFQDCEKAEDITGQGNSLEREEDGDGLLSVTLKPLLGQSLPDPNHLLKALPLSSATKTVKFKDIL